MEIHGFLNIDKPLGWTSHDVVGKLRRILTTRRVGHGGTLDPAASGVLVVGVGRATRFLDYVQHGSKAYVAHVVFGRESETADIDGSITEPAATQTRAIVPKLYDIETTTHKFLGTIDQVPPKYSALKLGGEPLYRRMRRGEDVEVPVREVRIDSISVLKYDFPDLVISVECGPGVYIRSLARDLGEMLGTTAYLHHLVRTQVGRFELSNALHLDTMVRLSFPDHWTSVAHAIDAGIAHSPAAFLRGAQSEAWYHGRSVNVPSAESGSIETVRAYLADGTYAGMGTFTHTETSRAQIRPRIVLARN
jgi:tRNA pseudouridine55 synthase